ncbi:hypothetical protein TNCV_2416401 [Trichonephila clavipes]|nr:hypothetical protein TNCV_2416401 [Trichonephila clavipes]
MKTSYRFSANKNKPAIAFEVKPGLIRKERILSLITRPVDMLKSPLQKFPPIKRLEWDANVWSPRTKTPFLRPSTHCYLDTNLSELAASEDLNSAVLRLFLRVHNDKYLSSSLVVECGYPWLNLLDAESMSSRILLNCSATTDTILSPWYRRFENPNALALLSSLVVLVEQKDLCLFLLFMGNLLILFYCTTEEENGPKSSFRLWPPSRVLVLKILMENRCLHLSFRWSLSDDETVSASLETFLAFISSASIPVCV